MNHPSFEHLIFSTENNTSEHQQQLAEHLNLCENCANLANAFNSLEEVLLSSPVPEPQPGFTQRWHARFNENRQKSQVRTQWLLTIGLFSIAGLILLATLLHHLQGLNVVYELSYLMARFSRLVAQVRASLLIFRTLLNALPIFTPLLIIFLPTILIASTALIFTWLKSIIRLYAPNQQKGQFS